MNKILILFIALVSIESHAANANLSEYCNDLLHRPYNASSDNIQPSTSCKLTVDPLVRFFELDEDYREIHDITLKNQKSSIEIPFWKYPSLSVLSTSSILKECGVNVGILKIIEGELYYMASTVGDYQKVKNVSCN